MSRQADDDDAVGRLGDVVFGCSNISRGESDCPHESVNTSSYYTVCVCVCVAGCCADRSGAGGGTEP